MPTWTHAISIPSWGNLCPKHMHADVCFGTFSNKISSQSVLMNSFPPVWKVVYIMLLYSTLFLLPASTIYYYKDPELTILVIFNLKKTQHVPWQPISSGEYVRLGEEKRLTRVNKVGAVNYFF